MFNTIYKLNFERKTETFTGYLYLSNPPKDKIDDLMRHLSQEELEILKPYKHEKRKQSFILGRYAAKKILSRFYLTENLTSIVISKGVFEHPVVQYNANKPVSLSISHCSNLGGAVCACEKHPVSIDIEHINPSHYRALTRYKSEKEQYKGELFESEISYFTHLWCLKEALSKIIRCGMMTPLELYETKEVEPFLDGFTWLFKNFAQYRAYTFRYQDTIISLVYPKNSQLSILKPA